MNKKVITALCFLLLFIVQQGSAQNYIISTVAGNGATGIAGDGGPAIDGSLNTPWGLAVDKKGNLFIVDINSSTVEKVDTNGILTTIAGPGNCFYGDTCYKDGPAKHARLNSPTSVAVDTAGNVYIADWGDLRIRKIDKNGIMHTIAGKGVYGFSGDGGIADSAEMTEPYGVAADDSGNVYFADAFNERVRKINTQGIITTVAGNGGQGYSGDNGLAVNASLNTPVGVTVDTAGNLYIADLRNMVIRKVNKKSGIITTVAGNGSQGFSGDGGPATSAQLYLAWEVAVDDSGNLYIPDEGNQRIRKVYTNGIIKTLAGNGTQGFSGDGGPAINAVMFDPFGIAVDHQGTIFFADEVNQRIRKLSPCSSRVKFKPSSPHVCTGQSIRVVLDDENTYTWSPASTLSSSTGYIVNASPLATTTYTINGTSCTASGTVVVTLDTFPAVKITPASETVCEGVNIPLSASGGNLTYKWSPNRGLNQLTGSSVMATGGFNTTYTVVGSNGYCSSKDSVILTIGNSFQPGTITSSKDSVCPGTPEKLTLTGSAGTIQWQLSDSTGHFKNIAGETNDTYSFLTNNTSSYRAVVSNGVCGDTSVQYLLNVLPDPQVSFISFKTGLKVIFSSTATGGVTNYSWDFGDNEMSNDSNPAHLYAKEGLYYVCLTVNNRSNCSFTTCSNVDVGVSGINNISPQADWNIYPNPADGQVIIEMNNPGESNDITITDVLGKVVYTQVLRVKKSTINLSTLPAGTYFVHLHSGNASQVRKLVKD